MQRPASLGAPPIRSPQAVLPPSVEVQSASSAAAIVAACKSGANGAPVFELCGPTAFLEACRVPASLGAACHIFNFAAMPDVANAIEVLAAGRKPEWAGNAKVLTTIFLSRLHAAGPTVAIITGISATLAPALKKVLPRVSELYRDLTGKAPLARATATILVLPK